MASRDRGRILSTEERHPLLRCEKGDLVEFGFGVVGRRQLLQHAADEPWRLGVNSGPSAFDAAGFVEQAKQ